jgi:hypothetical protein
MPFQLMRISRKRPAVRPTGIAAVATLTVCLALPAARAEAVVYKCVKNGQTELTDVFKAGCKALDLPGYVAAPAPRAAAPGGAGPNKAAAPAAPATNPTDFPRVDNATQRARDDDRKGILTDELRAEEKKLADLKRDFNNGEPERQGNEKNFQKYLDRVAQMRDDISRAEKNIEALKRELANTR